MSDLKPSAAITCELTFSVSVPWSHLTRTKQRLLGLESMSGLGDGVVSLEKCRLRRVVPTLIDMFGYGIGRRMGSPSVNSWCGFGIAVEEGLKGKRGDVVGVFVDVFRNGSSFGVIGSWARG